MVGPLILLECVRTKLVHYYLPSYPACALLAGWVVVAVTREGVNVRRWPFGRLGLALLIGVGVGLTVVFVAGSAAFAPGLRRPSLVTGLVIGSGTLWSLLHLYRAETTRAVAGLAATWSLTLLLLTGWMLPAAEPYRLSRIVGERLVRLSDEARAEPILLSYQEPTVVYTIGRPATMMRTWTQFYRELDRQGELATAILDKKELAEFRDHDDLEIEIRETVVGFDFNKGQSQTLHLALIRRKSLARATNDAAVGGPKTAPHRSR